MRFLAIALALALCVALVVTPPVRACNPGIVTGLRTVAYSANVVANQQFFTPMPSVRVVNNVVNQQPAFVAPAPSFTEIRRGGLRGLLFGERITQIR